MSPVTLLEETLVKAARLLKAHRIPYMVIGGIANIFWGTPRTTLDVDIKMHVGQEKLGELLPVVKKAFHFRTKDPEDFVAKTKVLPLVDTNGVRLDLILAELPYEIRAIKRAKGKKVGAVRVRICTPEDLVIHKIISDRLQDREDAQNIIKRWKGKLNRRYVDPKVRELSEVFAKPEIYKFYLHCFKK